MAAQQNGEEDEDFKRDAFKGLVFYGVIFAVIAIIGHTDLGSIAVKTVRHAAIAAVGQPTAMSNDPMYSAAPCSKSSLACEVGAVLCWPPAPDGERCSWVVRRLGDAAPPPAPPAAAPADPCGLGISCPTPAAAPPAERAAKYCNPPAPPGVLCSPPTDPAPTECPADMICTPRTDVAPSLVPATPWAVPPPTYAAAPTYAPPPTYAAAPAPTYGTYTPPPPTYAAAPTYSSSQTYGTAEQSTDWWRWPLALIIVAYCVLGCLIIAKDVTNRRQQGQV